MSSIILVDDQNLVKTFLFGELTANGHSVMRVDNPDEALSKILYIEPDLVLINVLINNLEGWDLLQRVKVLKPSLPVLIFSVFDCLKDNPRSAIADAQIITDFKLDSMIKTINHLLNMEAAMENYTSNDKKIILMADDDLDDYIFLRDAIVLAKIPTELFRVSDGVELMEYLHHRGKFDVRKRFPTPSLILLDINMPRKNGLETLAEIKASRAFKHIPIIMYTTSGEEKDISESFALGAESFITKPFTLASMSNAVKEISRYFTDSGLPALERRGTQAKTGIVSEKKHSANLPQGRLT